MNAEKSALLLALGVAALLASACSAAHAAPSFDCRRASSIVEKDILRHFRFSDLDRDIAASFAQALTVLSAADAEALRADQCASWLEDRDGCGDLIHGDPPIYADVFVCVRDHLTARVAPPQGHRRAQAVFQITWPA